MKKVFTLLVIIGLTSITNAQVGVQTDNPQETLDVQGTTRVRQLPESGRGNKYNGQNSANTRFNATKTVVADNQGVLGYVNGVPSPPVVTDDESTYAVVNKCVIARPGQMQNQVDESEITLDGISIRYRVPGTAAAQARVQARSNNGTIKASMIFPIGGAGFNRRNFAELNGNWENMVSLNFDTDEMGMGTFIDHTNGVFYRYTAAGWKENSRSEEGFCHSLERIGKAARATNIN